MKLLRYAKCCAVFASLCVANPLEATDNRGAVCSEDPSSALIFVGTLADLAGKGSTPEWSLGTFQVTELLQGESTVEVSTLIRNDLCHGSGETPAVGRTYLVLTHTLHTGSARSVSQLEHCEQIRPIEQATATLEYLRDSKRGSTPTEVSGQAMIEPQGYPWHSIPLPKIKIHVSGNQRSDFVSDEDGRFHGTLTSGKYVITVEFPAGYADDYRNSSPITVTEHRCTQVNVSAHPTGSISAHIVDMDGDPLGPMSNVQLTLETAKDQQFVQSVWPDENSNLKADNLLPGQYILGLNTYLPVSRSAAGYPPIYFPNVRARSDAQVITLGAGEQKVLSEMRIKKGKACEIPVQVFDGLGKPSPSTVVALAYPDYPHFYIEPREQTDANGRELVYAVFPGPALLRAEKELAEDGSRLESETVEISACPTHAVSLKLTRKISGQSDSKQK
jgi:hypothetical protein